MWLIGVVGLLVVGGLLWSYRSDRQRLEAMRGAETVEVALLHSLHAELRRDLGADSFFYRAELKGRAEVKEPLQSELTGTECIYYSMSVSREYEERYTAQEGDRRVEKVRRGSETMASQQRGIRFELVDGSGRVWVDPTEAEVVAESVLDRFEPAQGHQRELKLGSFRLRLDEPIRSGDRTTLGYRFRESVVRLHQPLYLLGEAREWNDEVVVGQPRDGGRWILSTQSEEQLTQATISAMRWKLVGAGVLLLASSGLIVADRLHLL